MRRGGGEGCQIKTEAIDFLKNEEDYENYGTSAKKNQLIKYSLFPVKKQSNSKRKTCSILLILPTVCFALRLS